MFQITICLAFDCRCFGFVRRRFCTSTFHVPSDIRTGLYVSNVRVQLPVVLLAIRFASPLKVSPSQTQVHFKMSKFIII